MEITREQLYGDIKTYDHIEDINQRMLLTNIVNYQQHVRTKLVNSILSGATLETIFSLLEEYREG